jgi:hypothetical protein
MAGAARTAADGLDQAAALFRAIADQHGKHALKHLEALEPCDGGAAGQSAGDTAL